jgi:hypothetical protein
MPDPAPLFPVRRGHLDALSNDIGIMQHAIGPVPDPTHGYCTDDVARALLVDLVHQRELGWDAVADRAWRNMRFLGDAFDARSGGFRNFRHADGGWLDGPASEDSQGRALLTLGEVIASAPDARMVAFASSLLERALPGAQELGALRALASTMLGCDAALRRVPSAQFTLAYRRLADRIRATFEASATPDWPWPESILTYENALPVRALIVGGHHLGDRAMVDTGLRELEWLVAVQTAPEGHCSPIGNGWWPQGGERSRFDQQPIEATALVLTAGAAFRATGDEGHRATAEWAYAWYLGRNDLGITVAEPERGASHDGLTQDGVNANEGAESTLMWLLALEHIRILRSARVTAPRPGRAVVAGTAGAGAAGAGTAAAQTVGAR